MNKKQRALPQDKVPVSAQINALTSFLNQVDFSSEELGVWFASTANYAHWLHYFHKDHDPSKVVGQDNFLRYVPRKRMALRIQAQDAPLDIFRVLAAALMTKTHLDISYDAKNCPLPIDNNWKQSFKEFVFISESDEQFHSRIKSGAYDRIRLLTKPTEALQLAASENATYLNSEPVLASGRLELLHYLREIAFSVDYHRYGNLGVREGEARTPVL